MKKEYDLNKLKRVPKKFVPDPEAGKMQINIRLDCIDLADLKTEAFRLGIPYQTLIGSILHRFITGELVDKKSSEGIKK